MLVVFKREDKWALADGWSGAQDGRMVTSSKPVLLYDGECGLCNALMRFMLKHDRRGGLHFSPLQGPTAQAFLRSRGMDTTDFDSLVFIDDIDRPNTAHHVRTSGALAALEQMGGGWSRLSRIVSRVPSSWRDALYKVIARLRYRIFGRYRPTPLPNPDWARRIID
jgi:predicted DCC family thiol-disulfide oxidoreductase YuxK